MVDPKLRLNKRTRPSSQATAWRACSVPARVGRNSKLATQAHPSQSHSPLIKPVHV